jgi:hypothetical protein
MSARLDDSEAQRQQPASGPEQQQEQHTNVPDEITDIARRRQEYLEAVVGRYISFILGFVSPPSGMGSVRGNV